MVEITVLFKDWVCALTFRDSLPNTLFVNEQKGVGSLLGGGSKLCLGIVLFLSCVTSCTFW